MDVLVKSLFCPMHCPFSDTWPRKDADSLLEVAVTIMSDEKCAGKSFVCSEPPAGGPCFVVFTVFSLRNGQNWLIFRAIQADRWVAMMRIILLYSTEL